MTLEQITGMFSRRVEVGRGVMSSCILIDNLKGEKQTWIALAWHEAQLNFQSDSCLEFSSINQLESRQWFAGNLIKCLV